MASAKIQFRDHSESLVAGSRKPSPGYCLTRHAQQRGAQRAIRERQIELIRLFGVDHLQKGGAMLSFIPDRVLSELRNALDRCAGVALVKGEGDTVLTVFHQHRKINHTEWVA